MIWIQLARAQTKTGKAKLVRFSFRSCSEPRWWQRPVACSAEELPSYISRTLFQEIEAAYNIRIGVSNGAKLAPE